MKKNIERKRAYADALAFSASTNAISEYQDICFVKVFTLYLCASVKGVYYE